MADNPQIKIGADLSGAEKAVEDFGKKLDAAAKPRKVDLDAGPAEKALDDLGKKGKDAGKSTALPGAAAGVKNVADELKKVAKLQADLAKAGIKASQDQAKAASSNFAKWRDSGARGTRGLKGMELEDFAGGRWRETALNDADAKRRRQQVFSAVGLAGDKPGSRSFADFARSAIAQTGRGVAGQILPSGGVGGSIAKEGVAEAAGAGGFLSGGGIARLAAGAGIGALAFGAIKLASGIKNSVGTAQEEGVDRSNLVRSVGDAVDEFEELRRSAQALAHGLDITAGEATSLARAYAAGSGIGQNERGRIYGEAGQAGSFARQTGLDVGTTVGQFADLRRNGQDSPERLGKSIADAMSKRGDFGRLSEVLGGLTSFASTVTGSSLTKANTDGVLDIASRLAALKLPGMGTAEGVGHVAAMDAGFRGGAGGEAGDMMLLQGMQRRGLPANGYDVKAVREAGLFASMSDVFGEGSAPYKAAQASGNGQEMSRLKRMGGAGGTTWDHVFADLQSRYSNPGELRSAVEAVTNGSAGDASALIAATKGGRLAGVTDKLKGLGIDTSHMNASQMVQASGVLSASPAELAQRKQDMLSRTGADALSKGDADSLLGAKTPDELRKAMAAIASKETIQTEGEKTRASLSSLQQAVENVAAKLVEYLNPIRDVLVKGAKALGWIDQDKADELMGISPVDKLKKQRADLQSKIDEEGKPSLLKDWWATDGSGRSGHSIRAGNVAAMKAQADALDKQIAQAEQADQIKADPNGPAAQAASAEAGKRDVNVAAIARAPSAYDKIFADSAKANGVDAKDLKLLAARESGMNPNASNVNSNGTVDYGIMQHNSRYLADRGMTVDDAMNPEKAIPAGAKLWRQLLDASHGDKREAARRWNGTGDRAQAYADSFMHSSAMLNAAGDTRTAMAGDAAPSSTSSAGGGTVNHAHSLEVTIKDPKGNKVAEIPPMQLHDGSPRPAGSIANGSGT